MNKLTAAGFKEWVDNHKPGDRLEYHDGNLGRDRLKDEGLDELADCIMMAVDFGQVIVYQERLVMPDPDDDGEHAEPPTAPACRYWVGRIG